MSKPMKNGHPARVSDPTPEEIAAACRRIRETWTAEERQQRLSINPIADDVSQALQKNSGELRSACG